MSAAAFALGAILTTIPLTVNAQTLQTGTFSLPDVPVLTIEPDRLFAGTEFGQSLSSEIEDRGTRLAAENRRIEGELADEESRLTALRNSTTPEEFRKMADAFDEKVTAVRAEQDAKARGLAVVSEQAQRSFLQAVAPILEIIMNERGASVVLDRRAVFFSTNTSDITSDLIRRIDEELGKGSSLDELQSKAEQLTLPAPQTPEQ